ncbi:hypothetical protein ACXAUS_004099 [Clostridium sporogenes]
MKITAEFNSNEEILNFINTFGAKTIQKIEPKQERQASTEKKEVIKETTKKDIKKEEKSNPLKNEHVQTVDEPKEDTKKEDKSPVEQTKKEDEPRITKEMVRAALTKLIQAGKQKEAKEITAKYGASKLPELKEEHYAAVIKEVEALL